MATKGLTKESIVKEAIKLIEQSGKPDICLHEISRQLGIKTPSLYNHIKNTADLENSVFEYAINALINELKQAMQGKEKSDALRSFAYAYIDFAIRNKGLYLAIMSIPKSNNQEAKEIALPLLKLVIDTLSSFNLTNKNLIHYQRIIRAILHGFIAEIYLDYFYYYTEVSIDESISFAIENFIKEIECLENK